MADASEQQDDYRKPILMTVMEAVTAANSVEGENVAVIELQDAVGALCDAIVMLVLAADVDKKLKDRRGTADFCRRAILTASNEVARRVAAGEEFPFTIEPIELQ